MKPEGPNPSNPKSAVATGPAGPSSTSAAIGPAGLSQPTATDAMASALDADITAALQKQDGVAAVLERLSKRFSDDQIAIPNGEAHSVWATVGCTLKNSERYHEALEVFWRLYMRMLDAQQGVQRWIHKGMPLVWMSECFGHLGYPAHAKRYLMLTLCEDAIREEGTIKVNEGGIYFRLVWRGLTHADFHKYATEFWRLYSTSELPYFPEALLQRIDSDWMTEIPSSAEALAYRCNTAYVSRLLARLGDGTGEALEHLAEYVLSCMPGCRTRRRSRSGSTDYDIVCSIDGPELDFRSELGRYFVCECKDWAKPADFTTMAKFCRILDSTKTRFGILFSSKGISRGDGTRFAAREQLKVFQDRGIVIVVLDHEALQELESGASLIAMLRRRYEEVRLDLNGAT